MTTTLMNRYLAARKRYIAAQFQNLNDMQLNAALATEGPLLLLAGAGSGKTTVLINRIANIIRFGRGSDTDEVPGDLSEEAVCFLENVAAGASDQEIRRADALCGCGIPAPWNILAITFTNKAAGELKSRLHDMLGESADDIWAMTFHSACCRILRRDIGCMGYTRSFTIYDSSDSERLMKAIIKEMNLDEKTFAPKAVLGAISREKDQMHTPEDMQDAAESSGDLRAQYLARAYARYQARMKENNALDFDDLIFVTVQLLKSSEDILRYYQKKFRYILVDEYQDTNHMQYELVSLLSGGYGNICVVGDDDQSIYRFRGASIDNILSFEKQFRGARVIRLEQNYRSTQYILDAANAVISHNVGRKGKRLWTANGYGEPISVYRAMDEGSEANYIAGQILAKARGKSLNDFAILYRTNAQSNALEFALKRNGISYRVIGGTRFFDRAEIKDMLSYLCVINNPMDTLRLQRIINNPPRGLGAKAIETAQRLAASDEKPLYHVISHTEQYNPLEKTAPKFRKFTELISGLAGLLEDGMALPEFYDEVLRRTGYEAMLLEKDSEENVSRLENVRELRSSIQNYIQNAETPSLAGFLEEISLYTDIEQYNESDDCVVMMTIHSAKGLEFGHVFLTGFEDGLFPGQRSIGDAEEMEEERRLCYVAITRAKKHLTITHAGQRMIYGRTSASLPSRFLSEIPQNCISSSISSGKRQDSGERSSAGCRNAVNSQSRMTRPDRGASVLPVSKPAQPMLQLLPGERVMHKAFGPGMVLTVMNMPGDALLEIAFDETGTKKLMAKTASQYLSRIK